MADHYIGLMSGTSMDGVDAAMVSLGGPDQAVQVNAHVHHPFPPALRQALMALNSAGADELQRAALAANALSRLYARAIDDLLTKSSVIAGSVRAIGAHGQTVRHRPGQCDGTGFTLQLLNGALLAELCGIDVVCDFRSRDVAAGGQGAPLVPAFHAAVFQRLGIPQAVLNLGGIGNITLLRADGGVAGFDCGPGNVLMDLWCDRHLNLAYDDNGQWARQGKIDQPLLNRLLAEPLPGPTAAQEHWQRSVQRPMVGWHPCRRRQPRGSDPSRRPGHTGRTDCPVGNRRRIANNG